jgi:hypothetical protein
VHNASSKVIKPCDAHVGRVDNASSHVKTRVPVTRQNITKHQIANVQTYARGQHCTGLDLIARLITELSGTFQSMEHRRIARFNIGLT